MSRRLIVLLASAAVCLALVACGGQGRDDYESDDNAVEKAGKDVGAVFKDAFNPDDDE